MNVTSFEVLTPAERVAALNRVFEGYVLPFHMSHAQFDLHVRTNDVDLSASPVLADNGEIIAAALVALRETRSWIGGFGVSPTHRGKGLGHQLLDHCIETAKSRNATQMQLEVLQNNPAAIALYESAGFKRIRELHSFRADIGERTATEITEITIERLLQAYSQSEPPCWQREPQSLKNQPQLYAVQTQHGAAAIRRASNVGQLCFICARTQDEFYALMESIVEYSRLDTLVVFNEPSDSKICSWASQANWQMPFKQFEMKRTLGSQADAWQL